jgi:hypothetical protein
MHAMPKRKLSKTVVEKLDPAAKESVIWDEALPGFGIRVKPSGVRSYLVKNGAKLDHGSGWMI